MELKKLQNEAGFDKNKKINVSPLGLMLNTDDSQMVEEILDDREQIMSELTEQMMLKVKEHMFLKERTAKDFVKPRRSETSVFENQKQSHDFAIQGLEQQSASTPKEDDQAFDKEAYHQIKSEIKRRREAKERLLKQGFPELKPYMSF